MSLGVLSATRLAISTVELQGRRVDGNTIRIPYVINQALWLSGNHRCLHLTQ
ncbi:MAG: hypothetical protein ACJA13_001871 [Paraglaciecola sp.]|jgi:hypothetical protein